MENGFSRREDDTRKCRETFSRSLSIVFRCNDDCLHANSIEKEKARFAQISSISLFLFSLCGDRTPVSLPFDSRRDNELSIYRNVLRNSNGRSSSFYLIFLEIQLSKKNKNFIHWLTTVLYCCNLSINSFYSTSFHIVYVIFENMIIIEKERNIYD